LTRIFIDLQKYQSVALKSLIKNIYVFVVLGFLIAACSPSKHIPPGKVYLRANKIRISTNVAEQDELYPFIRQRQNKKALWAVKVKMQQYLSFNDSNLAVKNEKKRARITLKNQRRIAKGKKPKEFKPVLGQQIKDSGEAPVIFSKDAAQQTATQFEKALFNKGFFRNEIFTAYKYNSDSTKVTVIYTVKEGPQFTLNTIALVIDDPTLSEAIKEANKHSKLHAGTPYNTEEIDKERVRFTTAMRNQGYFYFSKEYVAYEVDSNLNGNVVNIKTIIKNPSLLNPTLDSVVVSKHKKYTIGNITLNTSFDPNYKDNPEDSIHFENLIYMNLSRLKYNPHTFVNKLFFENGDTYTQRAEQRTYSRISGLNNFSYINIGFIPDLLDSTVLNCNILMTPMPSQSVGTELEGTNSSSNLGFSGYLNYLHRNVFGGAEELKIRFKGGVEAQQTNSEDPNETNSGLINTVEYGGEASLIFQELKLPYKLRTKILKKFNRPKTSLNFIINYQNRPDFERRLMNVSLGYFFTRKKRNTNEYLFYPIDISYINIDKSIAFQQRLNDLNNPLLDATYSNQFIAGARFIETWTNRTTIQQKSYSLNRAQFELAGNLLRVFDQVAPGTEEGAPYYTVGNVRYAQFVKVQNDWHLTRRINRIQSMAFKVLAGVGVPYGNSEALPYDRSFYGGGANDNRGWRARTLGPGSLNNDSTSKKGVDQVADIKIQISAEYRFTIVKSMEGALFADAGNIWLLHPDDENRPNANFEVSRFLTELALAAGPGIRLNFGFLLVRFDWGFKIYDPGRIVSERWIGSNTKNATQSINNSVFNLGIGYPF